MYVWCLTFLLYYRQKLFLPFTQLLFSFRKLRQVRHYTESFGFKTGARMHLYSLGRIKGGGGGERKCLCKESSVKYELGQLYICVFM